MKSLFRMILAVIALFILSNAGYLWLVSNYNLGLILTTALGAALLLYALFFNWINFLLDNRFGRVLKGLLLLLTATFVFVGTLISVAGRTDTVTFKEDAIIVLGAGIHGDQVSRVLAYRLDAALQYHKINPDAFIVVSGGQGPQETISEAEAMERYLLARGAAPDKILREEQACSTYENFIYAKALLDGRLTAPYKTAYITNRFHLFRAGRVAKSAGLISMRLHADDDPMTILPDYLRECCAVVAFWIRGR